MEKQKVTVKFQNKFCDKLYNTVQKAEFAWLKENCDNESKWVDLIQAVDTAMYNVIKEFFDNSGESDLEKRVKALEDYNEKQRQDKIAQLKAENETLEAQLKSKGMPSFEKWLKSNK